MSLRLLTEQTWKVIYLVISGVTGLWLLTTPSDSLIDKWVIGGSLVAFVIYVLSWDEKSRRFRLPWRLPELLILTVPAALLLLTVARTQWASPGRTDASRWVWSLVSISFYLNAWLFKKGIR